MKIRLVAAQLFRTDGRADKTKIIVVLEMLVMIRRRIVVFLFLYPMI